MSGVPARHRVDPVMAVKRFAAWLADEEGFDATPILAIKPPRLDQKAVAGLSDDELPRLLKACDGQRHSRQAGQGHRDVVRRDRAAGRRIAGAEGQGCGPVHRAPPTSCRGKGGKGRRVKFSRQRCRGAGPLSAGSPGRR